MLARSLVGVAVIVASAVVTTVAAGGPSCAQAKRAVREAQTQLSSATRAKNRAASALHRCVSRSGGRSGACQVQRSAFEQASAAHHDAALALRFAVSQQKVACR
jgi:hypothetical protein